MAEELAHDVKMTVKLRLPPGHRRVSHDQDPISKMDMARAAPHVIFANRRLKRHIPADLTKLHLMPPSKMTGYLCRNYNIIEHADAVYAFGCFEKRQDCCEMESVCGGTGWGVQMTIDYNRQFNQFGKSKELFVFDLDETCWFRLVKTEDETNDSTREPFKFERMKDYTPLLARKSAIIGTRDLPHWGRDAIKRLFDNTLEKLFHTKNIVENEYEDYVAKMLHDDPDVLNQSPPPPPKDTPCNPPDLMDENDNPWVWLWGTGWIRRKKIADNKKAEETEDPIEY